MKFIYLIGLLFTFNAISADEMSYPELNVTPRASERIKIELREEEENAWSNHLPVQVSALMTLTAGAMSSSSLKDGKDQASLASNIAMGTGALWLGLSFWAAKNYRPYKSAFAKLKKYNYKTDRQKLIVERMAEEEINRVARVGRNLRWFSVVSNLVVSANLSENVKNDSDAKIATSLSALASLLPLFFEYHSESVSAEQKKYKKKIYAPISMFPTLHKTSNGTYATGLALNYSF